MARPKGQKPPKEKMNLTLEVENKFYLMKLAQLKGTTASKIVEELVLKEYKKECRKRNVEIQVYDGDQLEFDDILKRE